jgi:hypothetical protein
MFGRDPPADLVSKKFDPVLRFSVTRNFAIGTISFALGAIFITKNRLIDWAQFFPGKIT